MSQRNNSIEENESRMKTPSVVSLDFNRNSIKFNTLFDEKEKYEKNINGIRNKKYMNIQNLFTFNSTTFKMKDYQEYVKPYSTKHNSKTQMGKYFQNDIYSNFIDSNIKNEDYQGFKYLKNVRNDENKLRKLIKDKKMERIEIINKNHKELLGTKLMNSGKGILLTSFLNQENLKDEEMKEGNQTKKIETNHNSQEDNLVIINEKNIESKEENSRKLLTPLNKIYLKPQFLDFHKSLKFATIDPEPTSDVEKIKRENKKNLKKKRSKFMNLKDLKINSLNRSFSHFVSKDYYSNANSLDFDKKLSKKIEINKKSRVFKKDFNHLEIFKNIIFKQKDLFEEEENSDDCKFEKEKINGDYKIKNKSPKKKYHFSKNNFLKNLLNNSDDEENKRKILKQRE